MYNVIDASTPRSGPGPWLSNVYITLPASGGLKLTAYGLTPLDSVTVRSVQLALDGRPTHETQGCFNTCPGVLKVTNSAPYALCGVALALSSAANVIYLKGVGTYALQFSGPSFVAGTVTVVGEEMPGSDISDLMMKCPCPCPEPVVIPAVTACSVGVAITAQGTNLQRVVSKDPVTGCLQEGPISNPTLCQMLLALAILNTRAHRCDDRFAVIGSDGVCAMVTLPQYVNGQPVSCGVVAVSTDLSIAKTVNTTSFNL